MLTSEKINIDKLESAASRLKILAHPMRISIIELLEINKQLTVTQIYEKLNLEQAAASNHLNMMKTHGILKSYRSGKNSFYTINEPVYEKIIECINRFSR
ncbi:MAG: metalloregulator ArsR/SmtB family transcription factor [Bacteroidota bacterium]